MKKYKIIAIIGKSASGKDTLLNAIVKANKENLINKIVPITTRPKRDYEQSGIDYTFVDKDYFENTNRRIIESSTFRDWIYATEESSLTLNKINIGVFTPKGLEQLKFNKNINCISIYLRTKDKIRIKRSLSREESPDIKEIFRRYEADEKDFKNIENQTTFARSNNDKIDEFENLELILNLIRNWYGEE